MTCDRDDRIVRRSAACGVWQRRRDHRMRATVGIRVHQTYQEPRRGDRGCDQQQVPRRDQALPGSRRTRSPDSNRRHVGRGEEQQDAHEPQRGVHGTAGGAARLRPDAGLRAAVRTPRRLCGLPHRPCAHTLTWAQPRARSGRPQCLAETIPLMSRLGTTSARQHGRDRLWMMTAEARILATNGLTPSPFR